MESEWRDLTLGEMIRLQRGHDLSDPQRTAGEVPVLGSAGLNGYHGVSRVKGPGVVIGRSGASFGKVHFSSRDYWPHNTALYVTDFLGNDELFTFHFLQTIDFSSFNSGSAQPSLNRNHIYLMPVRVPPFAEQRAMAYILSSLDNKIELNRRMNETLEGMAQALFKSWFVDFDPVIDNAIVSGNPIPEELADRAEVRRAALAKGTANREAAKPFPAAFEQTEELGWIPVGWEVGPVLRQAKLLSGGTPKTSENTYWDGNIKWASAKDVSQCGKAFLTETERTITQEGLDNSSTKVIPRFSTVIVSRGATTGRMAMFGDDIAMNQTCYALRFNTGHHFYGYCHARHFIDSLVQTAHGSIFDTITTKTFESSNVILASSVTSGLFEDAVQALFEKILTNEHAAQSLTNLRDTLLPKLISGELRIPEAEKLAEAALS